MGALLSHGAGISLQYRLLLEDAAKARNADILHLLFEHGAKSSSELVFAILEEALVSNVDSESWVPVFQVQKKYCTPFFFYKNTFYKNIQAEIPEKIRTSIRTCPASILGEIFFFSYWGQNLSGPIQNPITLFST